MKFGQYVQNFCSTKITEYKCESHVLNSLFLRSKMYAYLDSKSQKSDKNLAVPPRIHLIIFLYKNRICLSKKDSPVQFCVF